MTMTDPQKLYVIRAVIDRTSFRECVAIDGIEGSKEVCHDILKSHLSNTARGASFAFDASPCRCQAHPKV